MKSLVEKFPILRKIARSSKNICLWRLLDFECGTTLKLVHARVIAVVTLHIAYTEVTHAYVVISTFLALTRVVYL